MLAEAAIDSVVVPTVVHEEPLDETEPVTVDPERTSLSHVGVGGDCDAPESQAVDPPGVDRVMNSMLPLGLSARMTCAAFAASDSRSMTPALAKPFVSSMCVTLATICVLSEIACET